MIGEKWSGWFFPGPSHQQGAVQVVVVKRDKPLQANQLVILQLSALEDGWLLLDILLDCVRQVVVDFVGVVEGRF